MPGPIWGPRFPDQTTVYSPRLKTLYEDAAKEAEIPLTRGVYLAASGPTYETPAEIRAYRQMGADAVGMSTVPEAMLANAAGLEVAGISCITNRAAGLGDGALSHEEVVRETQQAIPRMQALIHAFIRKMDSV